MQYSTGLLFNIIFCSALQFPVLFVTVKRYHVMCILYSTLLYFTLLFSSLLYSPLLYSTLLYSPLFQTPLLFSSLLSSTPLYYETVVEWYSTLHMQKMNGSVADPLYSLYCSCLRTVWTDCILFRSIIFLLDLWNQAWRASGFLLYE